METTVKKSKITVRELVFTAMFAAITAVLSQISFPLPSGVPVTLQTFAAALSGYMLGKKWGTISITVYVLLGAVGVPVFAGLHGGFASITGVTGGFIWGFIPMALLCGLGGDMKNKYLSIVLGIAGLLVCHFCGIIQWNAIKGGGFVSSFLTVSAPYLIKDVVSVVGAYFVSLLVKKRVNLNLS